MVELDTPGLLDVSNLNIFLNKDKSITSGSKAIDDILRSNQDGAEKIREKFQSIIAESNKSGHLRAIAKKI